MARSRRFALSAQEVDPLSWFTGPLVPLVSSALIVVYGALMTAVTWHDGGLPALQPIAIALCAGAGLVVHAWTRPMRGTFGWPRAALALALAVAGMAVSAAGYAGTAIALELWWAPAGLALSIAGLGPYLAVSRIVVLGLVATVAAAVAALAILNPTHDGWGALGTVLLIAYAPTLATAATATFSTSVVGSALRLLERPSQLAVPGRRVRDEVAQQLEEVTVARLTARAAPFLEALAEAGRITSADRALAGQLARRMRDDLVTQADLSWLDSVAAGSRLVVVDPEHRAKRMNHAQRTALRAMLRAILETPGTDAGSLMVQLRGAADGATAVGVSLDIALPEGRRIMHLAPYYLTLGTTVDDLTLESERHLRLSFSVPAD